MSERQPGSNEYEIRLLRERFHKLNGTVSALVQTVRHMERTVDKLDTTVNEMERADEIAAEVAKRMRRHNRLFLSVPQKVGAYLLVIIGVIDFVRGFLG